MSARVRWSRKYAASRKRSSRSSPPAPPQSPLHSRIGGRVLFAARLELFALVQCGIQAGFPPGAAIAIHVFLRHHHAQPALQRAASPGSTQLGSALLPVVVHAIEFGVERVRQRSRRALLPAQSCRPSRTASRDSAPGKLPRRALPRSASTRQHQLLQPQRFQEAVDARALRSPAACAPSPASISASPAASSRTARRRWPRSAGGKLPHGRGYRHVRAGREREERPFQRIVSIRAARKIRCGVLL